MASIITKKVKGHLYFYAVESARVDGKPRIVRQIYLGSPANIMERLSVLENPEKPLEIYSREFGSIAAVLAIEEELGAREIIDSFVRKRKQGLSPGAYIVLAALNRCIDPKSKRKFAEWASNTSLPRLMGFTSSQVTSQNFWEHMNMIPEDVLQRIYAAISRRIIDRFGVSTNLLAMDTTNFVTYIDTKNPSALAQRGHSKAKRDDLKQVGLALLASMDSNIPLFFDVYPGNIHDTEEFAKVMDQLVNSYYMLCRDCKSVTLIYDKGNNSSDNLQAFYSTKYHFVGSLVLSHYRDLCEVPLSDFTPVSLKEGDNLLAYRTKKQIFGEEKTVVMVWNKELHDGQMQGLAASLEKAKSELSDLSARLVGRALGTLSKGRKPTKESVTQAVKKILSHQHMKSLLSTVVGADDEGNVIINWALNTDALTRL